jgi:hypothetical protein
MPVSVTSETTAPLAYDATAVQVQAALEALPSIALGDVAVVYNGSPAGGWNITFQGALANQDIAPVVPTVAPPHAMSVAEVVKGGSGTNEQQRVYWATLLAPLNPTFTLSVLTVSADVPEESMLLRWLGETLESDAILTTLTGGNVYYAGEQTVPPPLSVTYDLALANIAIPGGYFSTGGKDEKGQGNVPRAGVQFKATVRSTYEGSTYPKALEAVALRVQELLDLQRVTTTYDTTTAYITCDREEVLVTPEETATDKYIHNIQKFDIFVQNQ